MSIEIITFLMFGSMLVLMLIGIPLGVTTGVVATIFLMLPGNADLLPLISGRIYSFINTYALVAVPFFIFMAGLMERSGIAHDIFEALKVWAGRMAGGLGAITIFVATLLAATTGVVGGEIMLLGMIALPQLLRLGYDEKLSIGLITAGGALGTMIPPSFNLIIFALTANVSVGDLFTASFVPGLILSCAYVLYVLIRCQLNPALGPGNTVGSEVSLPAKLALLRRLALPLIVGGSVLGSIYLGVAAVTEAAGLGAFAMMLVTFGRGQLTLRGLWDVSMQTIRTTGVVLWLVFGAVALIGVYNYLGGISFIRDSFLVSGLSPTAIIAIMLLVWVVLGFFMEGTAICLLTVPIFAPIIQSLGYDLIWFGVMFSLTCQIGYLTPPLGTAAFYMKSVVPPHITLETIFRSLWPFIGLQLMVLLLLWVFPILATH